MNIQSNSPASVSPVSSAGFTMTSTNSTGATGPAPDQPGATPPAPAQATHALPPVRPLRSHTLHRDLRNIYLAHSARDATEKLKELTLFRGVTDSPEINRTLAEMEQGKPTSMPLIWGFRAYKPGQPLLPKEMNTLKSIADEIEALNKKGLDVQPSLILADLHAAHNNVPPTALPDAEGGTGAEGYEAYFDAVAAQAQKLGLHVVRLSQIFSKLEITPDELAARGAQLTRLPTAHPAAQSASGIVYLTEEDLAAYTKQAKHMVERYPTVPVNRDILGKPADEQHEALRNKALAYIHFRKGEGEMLLPRLPEFFGTNVLPLHVSDPAAGKIGVKGVYLFSRSNKDRTVADIPWKSVGKDVISGTSSKYSPEQIEAIKYVKNALRLRYGAQARSAAAFAAELQAKGYRGQDLVEQTRIELQRAEARQAEAIRINKVKQTEAERLTAIKSQVAAAGLVTPSIYKRPQRNMVHAFAERRRIIAATAEGARQTQESAASASELANELDAYRTYNDVGFQGALTP